MIGRGEFSRRHLRLPHHLLDPDWVELAGLNRCAKLLLIVVSFALEANEVFPWLISQFGAKINLGVLCKIILFSPHLMEVSELLELFGHFEMVLIQSHLLSCQKGLSIIFYN